MVNVLAWTKVVLCSLAQTQSSCIACRHKADAFMQRLKKEYDSRHRSTRPAISTSASDQTGVSSLEHDHGSFRSSLHHDKYTSRATYDYHARRMASSPASWPEDQQQQWHEVDCQSPKRHHLPGEMLMQQERISGPVEAKAPYPPYPPYPPFPCASRRVESIVQVWTQNCMGIKSLRYTLISAKPNMTMSLCC